MALFQREGMVGGAVGIGELGGGARLAAAQARLRLAAACASEMGKGTGLSCLMQVCGMITRD